MKSLLSAIAFAFLLSTTAFAQDADDTFEPEEASSVEEEAPETAQNKNIDQTSAKEVKAFLEQHIAHANSKNIDAYLGDFQTMRKSRQLAHEAFSKRALELKDLNLEILASEVSKATKSAATVNVRQRASYTNDSGQKVIDDVIMTYKMRKRDAKWQIQSTERRRLTTP